MHVVRVLVRARSRRLAAQRVLNELRFIRGGEEQVQLRQQRFQESIFPDRLALGDELVRIAGEGMAVGDGDGPLTPAPADELGEVAATVGVAAFRQARVHVVHDARPEAFHSLAEDTEVEVVVGVREIGDAAALAAGGAVNESCAGGESRMDVGGRHVDAVGGHDIVKISALRVQAVIGAFAEIDADGDSQAGPRDQRGRIARSARRGEALVDPLLNLRLGVARHVLGFALRQSALAHEPVGELEVGSPQIHNRCIQNQNIHGHRSRLQVPCVLSTITQSDVERQIHSSKLEARNPRSEWTVLDLGHLRLSVCLGFRYSDFEF